MRLGHTLLAVVIATALIAGATAYAGSGEAKIQRQRIAINMVVNDSTDTATFTVNRLPGLSPPDIAGVPLDNGAVAGFGGAFGTINRNGMRVMEHIVHPRLDGRRGTLALVQRFDRNEMQNGMRVAVGTWKVEKGTGKYSGVKGGGRYVAVSMLNGRTLVRQEGWVTGLG